MKSIKSRHRTLGIVAGMWTVAGLVLGQAQEPVPKNAPAEKAPGHSMHGEAFNEGPRQKAYLMPGMPKIEFPITTQSAEAQAFFSQGVGQLHGFWYFEAERSFRQAASLDTNAPMPYWGMAMANINNEKRAKEFIQRAVDLKDKGDRREQRWIESLAEYYRADSGDNKHRRREYVRKLEEMVFDYPEDVEVKAFLAFHIWDNHGRDLPITSHVAVNSLLEEVFRAQPMHPAHHYRIHLWDAEKPARGFDSASKCGQTSPGVAHMWHMPGHIHSKLHRYRDAVWQQEASARVDHAHMMRDRVLPDQIHNYAHNNQWLVENLMFVGRAQDAIDLAKNMIELPRHPKYNTFEKRGRSASQGRSRLLDVLARWELWDETIDLGRTMYLEATGIPAEDARLFLTLGIAYFQSGKVKKAEKQVEQLRDLLAKEKKARFESAEAAEAKARTEKKTGDEISKAMVAAMDKHTNALHRIENALAELKVYAALADDDQDRARKALEEAKEISKAPLARIHLQLGDKEKAEQLAREAVVGATNQVQALANYVEILHACGKNEEAKRVFEQMRPLAAEADLDLPVFKRLRPFVKSHGYPRDWRSGLEPSGDVGVRPDLASLGPFRWEPSPAPSWSLPDALGNRVTSEQFRGKPHLLIFYLGHGCLHCREQLNVFAPLAGEFAGAGISLIGVSMDGPDGLKKSAAGRESGFPFPLVSDESLEVFKQFRAFDDFEKMPLHGVFLVDGTGKVRWQDISHEPFTEAAFLLGESKRLLQLNSGALAGNYGGSVRETAKFRPESAGQGAELTNR